MQIYFFQSFCKLYLLIFYNVQGPFFIPQKYRQNQA